MWNPPPRSPGTAMLRRKRISLVRSMTPSASGPPTVTSAATAAPNAVQKQYLVGSGQRVLLLLLQLQLRVSASPKPVHASMCLQQSHMGRYGG